jgi:glycosyltransferase involved in cell wall biosynthesis
VGGSEARNIGVRSANGAWIAFLDDDDEWLPDKLKKQLAAAQASSATLPIGCCAYFGVSEGHRSLFGRKPPDPAEPISEYMFCRKSFSYGENALATSVLFVPRQLLLSVPFDPALKKHQDWDWALRALNVPGAALCYIGEPLSLYHMPTGIARVSSGNDWRSSLQWCRERRQYFTPKAFSFFLATECITRARQANASLRDVTGLILAYWREGQPTFRSAMLGLSYLFVPQSIRRLLLKLHTRPTPNTSP